MTALLDVRDRVRLEGRIGRGRRRLARIDRAIRIGDGQEVTVTSAAGMAVTPVDGRDTTSLPTVADLRLIAAI